MHATAVLQKLLRRSIPSLHHKRLTVLTAVVGSALSGTRLTLSALARGLDGHCAVRHRIKRVDRLLGNAHLLQERLQFYRLLCDLLIGQQPEPILIVDWSDLKTDRRWLLLRACVWVHGFALPVYEEVHPLKRQYSPRVQRNFLLTLRTLLADHVRPIVVSDAGFCSPWFQQVQQLGWHWLGRIRNRTMVEFQSRWRHCKTLYPKATGTPRDLGEHRIARSNPVTGRLALYRKAPKNRQHLNRLGNVARNAGSRKIARRESEPWLIAASRSLHDKTALDLINLYRIRMRIEHSFRTLKSHQFGFAFEDSQTRIADRITVLLLIHALALLLAWIAGWAAQRAGLHRQLKSNADRSQTSMSIITLGCMALSLLQFHLSDHDVHQALNYRNVPPDQKSQI